jgi:hypothetical protein
LKFHRPDILYRALRCRLCFYAFPLPDEITHFVEEVNNLEDRSRIPQADITEIYSNNRRKGLLNIIHSFLENDLRDNFCRTLSLPP